MGSSPITDTTIINKTQYIVSILKNEYCILRFISLKYLIHRMVIYIFSSTFRGMFETYEVAFEVYIEDKLTNKQTIEAPTEILIANFLQTAQQIQNDQRPIKLIMSRPEIIWDNFEQKQKTLNNEVQFKNNAMVSWEERRQNNDE